MRKVVKGGTHVKIVIQFTCDCLISLVFWCKNPSVSLSNFSLTDEKADEKSSEKWHTC